MDAPKPPIGPVLESYGWDGYSTGYGSWRSTRCPIHSDRRPSARVNEDEGFFRCFVCEISGDAYELVMKADGVDFPAAKEKVKELTGYDPERGGTGTTGRAGGSLSRGSARLTSSRLPVWARDKQKRDRLLSSRRGGR